MDSHFADLEKVSEGPTSSLHYDLENGLSSNGPAHVAFPEESPIDDEGKIRPKGPEMRRQMTIEEIQLAAAGYEHLDQGKAKSTAKEPQLDEADIREHLLTLQDTVDNLDTSFDTKDPPQSYGLTAEEAAARLKRDGLNALTPPKKKSALRKVCLPLLEGPSSLLNRSDPSISIVCDRCSMSS